MSAPGIVVELSQSGRSPLLVVVSGTLELGRECSGLNLADPMVSRRHCALIADGDGVTAVDLGSTNGIRINGTPVVAPTRLGPDDVLQLGTTTVRLAADLRVTTAAPVDATGSTRVALDDGNTIERPALAPTGGDLLEALSRTATVTPVDPRGIETTGTTVTIVFSDIESSTQWAERLGDQRWFDVLATHDDVVHRCVRAMGGTEIKNQGDGFMLTFPSARRAVLCAQDMQRGLARHGTTHPDEAIRVRIGLHVGEAINVHGDLFGKHVIVASRIAGEAQGGQILASSMVRELVESRGDVRFGVGQPTMLKGLAEPHVLHQVDW